MALLDLTSPLQTVDHSILVKKRCKWVYQIWLLTGFTVIFLAIQ